MACAQAQNYPSRQITLVVPFPLGGRRCRRAHHGGAHAAFGQPVTSEHRRRRRQHRCRPGRARGADGPPSTSGNGHPCRQHHLQADYDLQKDFEPIGLVSNNPQLMVAKKDLPPII